LRKVAKCAKKIKKLGDLCGFAREKPQNLARDSYPELKLSRSVQLSKNRRPCAMKGSAGSSVLHLLAAKGRKN